MAEGIHLGMAYTRHARHRFPVLLLHRRIADGKLMIFLPLLWSTNFTVSPFANVSSATSKVISVAGS